MKKISLFFALFAIVFYTQAQPAGYYDAAAGKTGAALKTALYGIINAHTERSYSQLWTDFQTTDKKADGSVWDMYSDCSYTFGTDQCGSYSGECKANGGCYNREHSFPKSWFNQATPMYTDLFHLYPTDGKVNGMRGNYPFGEVSSPTYTSGNGSKLGACSFPGYTGIVFEPKDEYKGDFARTYMYMVTCYENVVTTWNYDTNGVAILDGTTYPAFKTWFVNLLLKWNAQDPVSQKEIDRNNAVYGIQGNRNPYIDHPEWVSSVWGNVGLIFTSSPITTAVQNVAYSYTITATCDAGNSLTLACPTLPSWLTFTPTNGTGSASATLTGTSAITGPFDVDVTANDGTTTVHQTFTITVGTPPALQFTSTPITSATEDESYFYGITAVGPQTTLTMTCPTLPAWLTFGATNGTGQITGSLSGTPPVGSAGSYPVDIQITDGTTTVDQNFNIVVSAPAVGGGMETFTNLTSSNPSSYSSVSWTGDNGGTWTATLARTDQTINGKCICLKADATAYVLSNSISGGCSAISFKHQQFFSGSGGTLNLLVNGTVYGNAIPVSTTSETTTISDINVAGDFTLKFTSSGTTRIGIDDVSWSGYTSNVIITPNSKINVFPNPVKKSVSITGISENHHIAVVNYLGQNIMNADSKSEKEIIDFSNHSQGIYFIMIYENNKLVKTQKIIKTN
jgi:endonuclease I